MQFFWLKKGALYQKKDWFYIFDRFTPNGSIFYELDVAGNKTAMEFEFKALRNFRASDKKAPCVLEKDVVEKLQMENSTYWANELEKAQVQAAVLLNCKEILVCKIVGFSYSSSFHSLHRPNIQSHVLKVSNF